MAQDDRGLVRVGDIVTIPVLANDSSPAGLRLDLGAYLRLDTVTPAKLQISLSSGSVLISWSPAAAGQKLQWASDLKGPWADITGASNPYVAPATGTQVFYRVAQ